MCRVRARYGQAMIREYTIGSVWSKTGWKGKGTFTLQPNPHKNPSCPLVQTEAIPSIQASLSELYLQPMRTHHSDYIDQPKTTS
ncbi:hypothetical protein F2Q69_00047359 [Brassica cretica]|uniref:Uncharacterized protein n=1 Tax=Brassica cretica TaxID=69181 RepID=A0A8S9PT28_BRACR|nr:hypothetical protein F2Q69_00047359 [Brassica cretica]